MDLTNMLLMGAAGGEMPRGESTYAMPGTFTWVCPAGVTSVSVVCIGAGGAGRVATAGSAAGGGGGAIAWVNNLSVTPGVSYSVVVGLGGRGTTSGGKSFFNNTATVSALGGLSTNSGTGGAGGTVEAGTGFSGGSGGSISGAGLGTGGSAATYTGNGASGITVPGAETPQGGAGIFYLGGSGPSGQAGFSTRPVDGGQFGGGGSGTTNSGASMNGGNGAVRIVWPGATRTFPSTDVGTP
jgi:hypothetical protein